MPEGQAPWRSLPTPALTWSSITQLSRQCKALEDGSSPLHGYPWYTWSFQVLSSVSVCFKAQFPGFVQPFTLGGWFLDSDLVPFQIAPFGPHLYSHAVVRQNTSRHWGLIRTEHNRKTPSWRALFDLPIADWQPFTEQLSQPALQPARFPSP